jgi:prephenate dehydratase
MIMNTTANKVHPRTSRDCKTFPPGITSDYDFESMRRTFVAEKSENKTRLVVVSRQLGMRFIISENEIPVMMALMAVNLRVRPDILEAALQASSKQD